MAHAIDLKVNISICKDLKNLAMLQDTDPRLKSIKNKLAGNIKSPKTKFKLEGNLLFCR